LYNSALADLSRASKLDPSNVEAKNGWQQTFDLQYAETMERTSGAGAGKKPQERKAALPAVSKQPPGQSPSPNGWEDANARGMTALADGDLKSAIEQFSTVIKLNPQYMKAYVERGIAFFKLKKYAEAVKSFGEGLALDNSDATAHYCRGLAYDQMNQPSMAIADLRQAAVLDPTRKEFYTNLITADLERINPHANKSSGQRGVSALQSAAASSSPARGAGSANGIGYWV